MKKFLTFCLTFVLMFSASMLTGCKSKGKTKIGFESGNYSCSVNQDTFVFNENLTPENLEDYLLYGAMEDDITDADGLKASLPDLFNNTYIQINDYNIKLYNYEIDECMYLETCMTISDYKFKKNVLTFTDEAGTNFKITKNSDNSLTLIYEEGYDFGDYENIDIKTVFTVEVILNISSDENPIVFPTPETSLYSDKTVSKQYTLTSITNIEEYFDEYADLFEMVGISSASAYEEYLSNNSNGTLILFSDYTLYYETDVNLGSIFEDLMGAYGVDIDMTTRIGYLYSYEPSSQNNVFNVMNEQSLMFTFTTSNDGANITLTLEDLLSDSTITYNFTEVIAE